MTDPSSGTEPIRHVVEPPEVGKTLAAVVRTLLGAIPWSRARDLVASGRVHVDGKAVVDEVARMTLGAVVEVRASASRGRASTKMGSAPTPFCTSTTTSSSSANPRVS